MLSNIRFNTGTSYWVKGESMLDYSKDSIIEGDILKCNTENLLPILLEGNLSTNATVVFIFHLFTGQEILAQIIDVKIDLLEFKLRFLNPDKGNFPDQVLHFDDVKHFFKVSEVNRLISSMNNLGPAL